MGIVSISKFLKMRLGAGIFILSASYADAQLTNNGAGFPTRNDAGFPTNNDGGFQTNTNGGFPTNNDGGPTSNGDGFATDNLGGFPTSNDGGFPKRNDGDSSTGNNGDIGFQPLQLVNFPVPGDDNDESGKGGFPAIGGFPTIAPDNKPVFGGFPTIDPPAKDNPFPKVPFPTNPAPFPTRSTTTGALTTTEAEIIPRTTVDYEDAEKEEKLSNIKE